MDGKWTVDFTGISELDICSLHNATDSFAIHSRIEIVYTKSLKHYEILSVV